MSCDCLSSNVELAKKTILEGEQLSRPIEESHFSITFSRCLECDQVFIRIFTELVDWVDGDDAQRWVFCPISQKEADKLMAFDPLLPENVISLGISRRQLIYDWPTGKRSTLRWREEPLWISPHD